MAMIASMAIVVMLISFFMLGGVAQDPQGFLEDELEAPAVTTIDRAEERPGTPGELDFPARLRSVISYTPMYEGYGGIVELQIENQGSNYLFVPSYRVQWEGGNDSFSRNSSALVGPGEIISMGVLHLPGPGSEGNATFEVAMVLWSSSANGNLWYDKGETTVSTQDVVVLPESPLQDKEVHSNPVYYYNKVNGLVNFEAVQVLMEDVLEAVPGIFSVHQVIEAYELVRANFAYFDDEENHWQSTQETIELGGGDCEDHAILLASLLTAMGGDCRINLISGHAFPTLFVGNSISEMSKVRQNIWDYYGNEAPVYWTLDDLGYWLLVDTVGMPYVGGFPAASIPVGTDGGISWNFEDGDWIRTIDVTGEIVPGLVF